MALTATIFKATLQVSDLDRQHFGVHALTLARHPSETDERMMVRLLAFLLHADEHLTFTKGLCADDEPDLWQKGLTGETELWIDVGLPDERRVRRACSRARRVCLYTYGGRAAQLWWEKNAALLRRFDHLEVIDLSEEATSGLASLAQRSMQLEATVQEGQVWLSDGTRTLSIEPLRRLG